MAERRKVLGKHGACPVIIEFNRIKSRLIIPISDDNHGNAFVNFFQKFDIIGHRCKEQPFNTEIQCHLYAFALLGDVPVVGIHES